MPEIPDWLVAATMPRVAPSPCTFDPEPLAGGQFHCPDCGETQLAGMPHLGVLADDPLPPDDPGRVLCVGAAAFRARGPFDGFRPGCNHWLGPLLDRPSYAFHARTKGPGGLEEDSAWKQVVAYVCLRSRGRVALFERTGGDGRLTGRLTVGLGGHVELRDVRLVSVGEPDLHAAIRAAALREVAEEVAVGGPEDGLRRVGLVNDDRDAIGKSHLGIVFTREVIGSDIGLDVRDPGLRWRGWFAPDTLDAPGFLEHMESWSRILIEELLAREPAR